MKTVTAEVLVIGGGLAGAWAAIKAKEAGREVVLIDKGKIGRSGSSVFAAGSLNICFPQDDKEVWLNEIVERGEYLNDQEWVLLQLNQTYPNVMELDALGKRYGMKVLERGEDGEPVRKRARGNIKTFTTVINALPMMDTLVLRLKELGIPLYERVMAVDLLAEGDRVCGAVGLAYRENTFYTFLAKAVVMAAGGCGFKSFFLGHKNLTGEGQAMAYEKGAVFRNLDQAMSNTTAKALDIHGLSLMVGLGGRFLNKDDKEFMWEYEPEVGNRARLTKLTVAMAKEAKAGRAPLYLDLRQVAPADQELLKKILPEGFKAFSSMGLDPFRQKIEWIPAFQGSNAHGGGIAIDTRCSSNIPGLYAIGDSSCTPEHGTWSITGLNLAFCFVSGFQAGTHAANEVASVDLPDRRKTAKAAKRVMAQALAPLDRIHGLAPEEVTRKIQETIIPYDVCYLRHQERLEVALEKMARLRREEVQKVSANSTHSLMKALEVPPMALVGEMILRSALYRKESRGFQYREDFPLTDNIDWLRWIMVKKDGGEMRVWAEEFPTPYVKPPREKYPPR
jgi:succinate dehydrogenase / fumarate reductase flavoprotein subunit